MVKHIAKRVKSPKGFQKLSAVLVIVAIAIVGTLLFVTSHAATPYVNGYAANGTRSGIATLVTGGSSSSNQAVQFGSGSGPTTPVNLMPLGDSITAGYTVAGGYRTQLWQQLTQTDKDDINFVGSVCDTASSDPAALSELNVAGNNGLCAEGNSGWCINDGSCCCGNNMQDYVAGWLDTYKPNIILLHAGTNDIYSGATGAQVTSSMSTLLGTIFATLPNVHVLLAQIIPIINVVPESNFTSMQTALNYYNGQIPGLASTYSAQGDNIQVVNMSDVLNPNTDYYTGDGTGDLDDDDVHPNQAGYNIMASTWYPAVTTQYNEF